MKNILVTSTSVPNHVGRKTKMMSLCPIYGNERRFSSWVCKTYGV